MKPLPEFKPLDYAAYEAYCKAHDRIAYHDLGTEWPWHYVYMQALVEANHTLDEEEAREIVNELIRVRVTKEKDTPMTWQEYRELALKTESIPTIRYQSIYERNYPNTEVRNRTSNKEKEFQDERTRATRLMHAAAGLVTETDELINFVDGQNLIEELGDCFWYIPIIEQCLDTTFEPDILNYDQNTSPYLLLQRMASAAAELIDQCLKRHIIYGKELDLGLVKICTQKYIDAIYAYIENQNIMVEKVWEANITKLKKRYPDGRFDVVATSNRDIENELSHIVSPLELDEEPKKELEDIEDKAKLLEVMEPAFDIVKQYRTEGIDKILDSIDNEISTAKLEDKAKDIWNTPWFPGNANPSYEEPITPLYFKQTIYSHILANEIPQVFASWALKISNGYRSAGADCVAEGFKEIYVKLSAIKGSTTLDKAEAAMIDGWMLFCLMPNKPEKSREFLTWLMSNKK